MNFDDYFPYRDKDDRDIYFLTYYHSLTEDNFKNIQIKKNSYYNEIISYKQGKDIDIRYFADPLYYCIIKKLIGNTLLDKIYLIPAPSSKPKNNNDYINTYIQGKNRDNRNDVLCNYISKIDTQSKLISIDLIDRNKEKEKLKKLSIEEHLKTLVMNKKYLDFFLSNNKLKENSIFLIIDDVTTTGNILLACEKQVNAWFGNSKPTIYKVAIAKTVNDKFHSIDKKYQHNSV